ncbi:MAG: hypothetical protein HN977_17425, partial [Gammaproteobacteria bacterium]|nr:hypothetical protein [Gammaproteobacteria bacterium]
MKKILLIFGICLFLSGNSWAARTISSATVDSQTTVDTTPVLTGTFSSSDSAGGFSIIVDSVTYTLAGSSE